jgi:hypothetical protein
MSDNRRYRFPMSVFNRPFWRDWIFWLFSASVVLPIGSNLATRQTGEPVEPVSGIIDAALLVAINYVVFAVIPSVIRTAVRLRGMFPTPPPPLVIPPEDTSFGPGATRRVSGPRSMQPPPEDTSFPPGPGTCDIFEEPVRPKGTERELGRLSLRIVFGVTAIVIGLFVHGNWEYLRLVSTIEGGEAVLEGYNRETKVLLSILENESSPYSQSRVLPVVTKWQEVASSRNVELQLWLKKIERGGIAPWNDDTETAREFAESHFVAWSRHLESEALKFMYDTRQSYLKNIDDSFSALCTFLENDNSPLSWPSSTNDGTKSRVRDICDE